MLASPVGIHLLFSNWIVLHPEHVGYHFLEREQDGEEVLVCDRNKPVARIVPYRLETRSEQEQRLVARGVLTPPLKKRRPTARPHPPGKISDEVMERVLRQERKGR